MTKKSGKKNTKREKVKFSDLSENFQLLLAIFLVIGFFAVIALGILNNNPPVSKGEFVCVQTQCEESQFAGEQWVQENCRTLPGSNGTQSTFCLIQSEQGPQQVPLAQINTSNIYQCTESVCTQRVWMDQSNSTFEDHEDYFFQR